MKQKYTAPQLKIKLLFIQTAICTSGDTDLDVRDDDLGPDSF